jgi:hypothetical protein
MRTPRILLYAAAVLCAAPLAGCATGKSEVPDCVKRYTGADCSCHTGGLGATTLVAGVNKTVAGATKGAATDAYQGCTSFCGPLANIAYAPVGIVGGVFTGITDGVGHVPAVQNCHYNFGSSMGYAWSRDYWVGTQNAQVPEHRYRTAEGYNGEWNAGAYWPGGPRGN